ncbi:hypothetical protein [Streptomyces sp. NPDC096153]|uniref:hypothetical protein n=1 Tax=Streptomyces sp. NPDC096153 TaxID=3155548 RepID=UPI0033346A60
MPTAWATPQQVIDITGVTVAEQQLAQAQDDIEIFSGRTYDDTPRIRARDLYWLRKAVARQAAWLTGQFGIETRMDLESNSQDGVSNAYKEDGIVLAPMAARALKRCSWMRSRTIHIRSAFEGSAGVANALLEASDAAQDWRPMP